MGEPPRHNELAQNSSELSVRKLPNDNFEEFFSHYVDDLKKRKNLHFYNVIRGANIYTGSFMTWFGKESLLTPWSWIPSNRNSSSKQSIPFGANEVDCVVNSNVLNTLAAYDKKQTPGFSDACRFVNKAIRKKKFSSCGVYYPNHYELHYTSAKALVAGADCLEESRDGLVDHIISTQLTDGSLASYNKKNTKWSHQKVKKDKKYLVESLNNKVFISEENNA